MRVAIVSVGDEVTGGDTTDTNAAWLARRLREVGADVDWHLAVGDDHGRIVEALRWLLARCDVLVVGGGIGPTSDDRTRGAVAEVAGVGLERRDELAAVIADRFDRYGVTMPAGNDRQAHVPAGATAFAPIGTAPGFRVEVPRPQGGTCVVYVLPGVPFELREMAERDVISDVLARGDRRASVTRTVHVTGAGESRIAELLAPVEARSEDDDDVTIAYLSSAEGVRVRISARGGTTEEARERAGAALEEVVGRLGPAVAGVDDERVEENVARMLRRAGLTVATGESCTAGLVAARLSSVSGASDYLRGGLVAYATDVKSAVLGVPEEVLDAHGPCSRPTAEAMAQRAREVFRADVGLGVVCVAGPRPQNGSEVGSTAWAVASEQGVRSWSRVVPGDRATITSRAAATVIEALRRYARAVLEERG